MFIESHRKLPAMPEGDIHDTLWEGNFIPGMTTLIRRECFERFGLFDEDLCYEDWDMWLRISRAYEFAFCRWPLARYRIVATSMVRSRQGEMGKSTEEIFLKHLLSGNVPSAQRPHALAILRRRAMSEYQNHGPRRKELMNALWALRGGLEAWFLWLCCRANIGYAISARLLDSRFAKALRRVRRSFRGSGRVSQKA